MKYTHFELKKHDSTKENNFRRWFNRLSCTVYLFISLASPTIQSDDASIKRRFVVNECGARDAALLRGRRTLIFLLSYAALN